MSRSHFFLISAMSLAYWGLPWWSSGWESLPCNSEDEGSIPGQGTKIPLRSNMLWSNLSLHATTRAPAIKTQCPHHLTCLLRNLYTDQEATVRILYGTTDWFKTEEGVGQGCLLSSCLFNQYAEHIMKMLGWVSYRLESRQEGETSTTSDMWMIPL